MLKNTIIASVIGLGFIVSAPAMAHGNHDFESIQPANHYHHQPARHCLSGHRIDKRQVKQRNRIRDGVQSGRLVHWEKKQLNKQQRRIRRKENRMRSDGCLTRYEFNKLMNLLDQASHRIRELKSNHIRNHNCYNRHDRHDRCNRPGRH
nr:MAG: hypothetical protein CR976_02740 [Thiotrichales bacterium]